MSPFDYIIQDNTEGIISYLETGNVNIVDEKGLSLLCYAIKLHRNECVKQLLKHYVNIDLADHLGNTAFHYAVQYNRLGYLKMLLKTEGNPLTKNNQGRSPLFLACQLGREDMIKLYLEYVEFPFDDIDEDKETIFMALVRSKNLSLLQEFGTMKQLECENHFGDTALGIAVKIGCAEMASFLLASRAFANHKNHIGETPLFYAIRRNNIELMKLLLQYGASVVCKNCFQETIFDIKMESDMRDVLTQKMSLEPFKSYAKKYPLHLAIYKDDIQAIEKHLQLRYAFIEDCYGYTPYDIAMHYQKKELMQQLTELKKTAHLIKLKQGK